MRCSYSVAILEWDGGVIKTPGVGRSSFREEIENRH